MCTHALKFVLVLGVLSNEPGVVDGLLDLADQRLFEGGADVLVNVSGAGRAEEVVVSPGQWQRGQGLLETGRDGPHGCHGPEVVSGRGGWQPVGGYFVLAAEPLAVIRVVLISLLYMEHIGEHAIGSFPVGRLDVVVVVVVVVPGIDDSRFEYSRQKSINRIKLRQLKERRKCKPATIIN